MLLWEGVQNSRVKSAAFVELSHKNHLKDWVNVEQVG
jgi:hypothetical protein